MMTQTHLLIAAAAFARRDALRNNQAVIVGAFIPDLAIFALAGWAFSTGIPQQTLWRETYYEPGWQAAIVIGNSLPLYLALLGAALVLSSNSRHFWRPVALFAFAAISHIAGDLPFHHDDAHAHFWPVTEWRFISPLSYWDSAHHAGIVRPVEAILGIALAILLMRRFRAMWVRLMLAVALAAYIAIPVFFLLSPGSG
jgi:hypothetical protein